MPNLLDVVLVLGEDDPGFLGIVQRYRQLPRLLDALLLLRFALGCELGC